MGGHHKIYSHWKIYFKSLLLLLHTCHCFDARLQLVLRGKVMWCVNCCDNTENISVSTFVLFGFLCSEWEMWGMTEAGSIWVVLDFVRFFFALMTKMPTFTAFNWNFIWHLKFGVNCLRTEWFEMWQWFGTKNAMNHNGFNISLGVHFGVWLWRLVIQLERAHSVGSLLWFIIRFIVNIITW